MHVFTYTVVLNLVDYKDPYVRAYIEKSKYIY